MITSTSNPQIKNINSLLRLAKERRRQGLFVAEGRRMCEEAPLSRVEKVYISESYVGEYGLERWEDVPVEITSDDVFRSLSDTKTPQGILALVRQDSRSAQELIDSLPEKPLVICLENLQDPGNLGTILRTAEGAGVDAVFMSKDCVDLYSPKVTRSTMGAMYRMPVGIAAGEDDFLRILSSLQGKGIVCYAAIIEESVLYTTPDYRKGTAFLIGNEGNGLTPQTIALCDGRIRIPMAGKLESLNASVAASLLMYEAARQRNNWH